MNEEQLLERNTTDPKVLVGKPVIRGLRISVTQILKMLARGISTNDILMEFPDLVIEDIQAVLLYSARLVNDEQIFDIQQVI